VELERLENRVERRGWIVDGSPRRVAALSTAAHPLRRPHQTASKDRSRTGLPHPLQPRLEPRLGPSARRRHADRFAALDFAQPCRSREIHVLEDPLPQRRRVRPASTGRLKPLDLPPDQLLLARYRHRAHHARARSSRRVRARTYVRASTLTRRFVGTRASSERDDVAIPPASLASERAHRRRVPCGTSSDTRHRGNALGENHRASRSGRRSHQLCHQPANFRVAELGSDRLAPSRDTLLRSGIEAIEAVSQLVAVPE
jgi:hypothetical protein